jgi:hypothetical protein
MPEKKASGWANWKARYPERNAVDKRLGAERRSAVKQKYVDNYLSSHPCVDCGLTESVVLDFDHVYGKKTCGIRALVIGWASLDRLKKEIAKCEIRCANDHRRRHAKALSLRKSCIGRRRGTTRAETSFDRG